MYYIKNITLKLINYNIYIKKYLLLFCNKTVLFILLRRLDQMFKFKLEFDLSGLN